MHVLVGDIHEDLGWLCSHSATEAWLAACVGPQLQQGQRGEEEAGEDWRLGRLGCVNLKIYGMKISGSVVAELALVCFSGKGCWSSLQSRLLGIAVTSAVVDTSSHCCSSLS